MVNVEPKMYLKRYNMASTMPRPDGKAKKIAYKIMGKPANMQKKTKRSKLQEALLREETNRVR